MKKTYVLLFTFVLIGLTSCSKDEMDGNSPSGLVGSWMLTDYEIGVAVDIDKDGSESINLLDEITCQNNEILIFESNGTVASNDTFNPSIDISKSDLNTDYIFDIECAEGVIGFATSYTLDNNTVTFSDEFSTISGNKLTRIIENAIEIYNEDFSEIVEIKNLTLIYTKQ